jgi:PAS domain S-box-containing protein
MKFYQSIFFKLVIILVLLMVAGSVIILGFIRPYAETEIANLVQKSHLRLSQYLAKGIDEELLRRMNHINSIVKIFPNKIIKDEKTLTSWLSNKPHILHTFKFGLAVIKPDGTGLLAQFPHIPGRSKINYSNKEWFIKAKKSDEVIISKPFMGEASKKPIITFAKAVKDDHGEILGVLYGVSSLTEKGFMDFIYKNKIGDSGGFTVVSPQDELIVASSDPKLVFKKTPARGKIPFHDKLVDGFRGLDVNHTISGRLEVVAVSSIPTTNWFVSARMPVSEAYKPIYNISSLMTNFIIFGVVLYSILITIILFYFFKPIFRSSQKVHEMNQGDLKLQKIEVSHNDEVGSLIEGFNTLVDKINQRTKELDMEKSRFQLAIESSDGLFDWNITTNEVYYSPQWKALLGYDDHEIQNDFKEWEALVHPDDLLATEKVIEEYLQRQTIIYDTTFRMKHKNGYWIWINAKATLSRDEEGNPIRMVGFHTNVTELVEYRNSLEKKVKEEVKKNIQHQQILQQQSRLAQMGEMISMIAHQWRQPLGAISSNILSIKIKREGNRYNLNDKEDRDRYFKFLDNKLDNVGTYVQTLSNTIDDFRNFFKLDKQKENISIIDPIEKALNIVSESMKNKGITINKDFKCTSNVNILKNEMMQVILNLLKNSEDHFIEKRIKNPTLDIKTFKLDNICIISISDNAGGIPAEILPNIFDPYFSTKDEKNGTGLGLYMSKIIVEEHHKGRLEAKNCNNGVEFKIVFAEEKVF